MVRLYGRVLGFLKAERGLATSLAVANVLLAVAAFAEPLLMGRIIDGLTHLKRGGNAMSQMLPLIRPGLVSVSLPSAQVSSSPCMPTGCLTQPPVQHGGLFRARAGSASGLPFGQPFRPRPQGDAGRHERHGVAVARLLPRPPRGPRLLGVLLPMTLFINWQLGSILVVLVLAFTALTTFVMRRTETLQGQVEHFNSGLAAHASDALGNVAVIQSFTRAKAEKDAMRDIIAKLLAAQIRSCPGGRSRMSRPALRLRSP